MPWYLYRLNPDYPDNATLVQKNNDNESKAFMDFEQRMLDARNPKDRHFFYSICQKEKDDDMAKEKAIQHLKDTISQIKATQEKYSKK